MHGTAFWGSLSPCSTGCQGTTGSNQASLCQKTSWNGGQGTALNEVCSFMEMKSRWGSVLDPLGIKLLLMPGLSAWSWSPDTSSPWHHGMCVSQEAQAAGQGWALCSSEKYLGAYMESFLHCGYQDWEEDVEDGYSLGFHYGGTCCMSAGTSKQIFAVPSSWA